MPRCTYMSTDWLLPVIQLWHMEWADLAHCINTHWGDGNREGGALEALNTLLGRRVKPALRPDFYPAQCLALDSLRGEVLDCFRCGQSVVLNLGVEVLTSTSVLIG